MIIKYGTTDITNLLLEYKRQGSTDNDNIFLLGNTPSYELDLKIDNSTHILETLSGLVEEYDDAGVLKGTYLVYESPKKYTDVVELVCFDKMLLTNVPYDSKLYYPTTIKDQLNEIGQLTGLSIIASNIPADVLNQKVYFWDNTLSCRDYLGWIAEISGMNAFCNAAGKITFKTLSTTFDWKTEDVESYTIDETFVINRVCFDNGLLKLEQGNMTGNTLYLSSDNPYIDTEHNSIGRIYQMYNGWKCISLESMKAAALDNLKLFDVIEFQGQRFICLDVESVFHGGQFQIQNIKGKLNSKNAEKVTIKYDNNIKIKKLQVLIDQNTNKLNIIAHEQDDLNNKYANLEVSLSGINGTVSSMQTDMNSMEQRIYTTEQNQTSHAIITTISSGLKGNDSISTTKFIMDSSGLHIKNGGFDISNIYGTKVLYADTEGNLSLKGTITGSKINGGNIEGTIIDTTYVRIAKGNNITLINSEGLNTSFFVCSGAGQVNSYLNVGDQLSCRNLVFWDGIGKTPKGAIKYNSSSLDIKSSISNGKIHILSSNNKYQVGVEVAPANETNYTCFFRPVDSGWTSLGSNSFRWGRYFGTNADSISSDERLKSNIQSVDSYNVNLNMLNTTDEQTIKTNLFECVFKELQPKTYYMRNQKKDKLHIGFVAQDIVDGLKKYGCTEDDLDLIQHGEWFDEKTGEKKEEYALVYNDLIALNTYMIQKCMKRINELERKLSVQKGI